MFSYICRSFVKRLKTLGSLLLFVEIYKDLKSELEKFLLKLERLVDLVEEPYLYLKVKK